MRNWKAIEDEATEMLVSMIKINTVNPPGNEMELIREIESIAKKAGLFVRIFPTGLNRGNIMVSMDQSFEADLIFLSHLDVVGVDRKRWKHDPFAGIVEDGMIWGRGALDTKQLTVMQLMTMILLKREGWHGDNIVLLATADEEMGSEYGLKHFLSNEEYSFEEKDVLSEGGGFPIVINNKTIYLCECGQKGNGHIKIWFEKKQGENPYYHKHTQLSACAKLIQEIGSDGWETPIPDNTRKLISHLYGVCGGEAAVDIDEELELIREFSDKSMMKLFTAMTKNTFAITRFNGYQKMSKEVCSFEIDVRTLPGVSKKMLEEKIQKWIAGTEAKAEILRFQSGFESDSASMLFESFEKSLHSLLAEADLMPFVSVGGSDGRHLQAGKTRVYGFSPTLVPETFERVVPMVHGDNERISKASLTFGIQVILRATRKWLEANDKLIKG